MILTRDKFIIKTLQDRNFRQSKVTRLAGCEGQATFNPLDTWYRQYMGYIYTWGGSPDDIPEPYRTIYLQYGTYRFLSWDFTCKMNDFTPGIIPTLYNALPELLNPANNAGIVATMEANKTLQTTKQRQDYFYIFKNSLSEFITYYFSKLPRTEPNLTEEQRKQKAFQRFQEAFNATLDTYSNETKNVSKPWWQEVLSGVAGILGIGFVGDLFGVKPGQGFSFTMPNGTNISYAGAGLFGQTNLSTILILGAGAGLLLAAMQKRKRK